MKLFTIGFTKKSAEDFFAALQDNGVEKLIDIRLNSNSQLAGFAKDQDLKYFLPTINGIPYVYQQELTPTKEIMTGFRDKKITWLEFEEIYNGLLETRGVADMVKKDSGQFENACLLCSEAEPTHCHRRLAAEFIKANASVAVEIVHL